jgi:hypothetical protein
MPGHATANKKTARIEDAITIRLAGGGLEELRQTASVSRASNAGAWSDGPLTDRQLRRYLEWANLLIADIQRDRLWQQVARSLARREDLYRRAIVAGDLLLALEIDRDALKLLGLYPDQRRTHQQPPLYPITKGD